MARRHGLFGVSQVRYEERLANREATPTAYGWLAQWNTTGVSDGSYMLTSVAGYLGGVSGTSPRHHRHGQQLMDHGASKTSRTALKSRAASG